MKSSALVKTIDELISETKKGHLNWQIELQSTDELDDSKKEHVTQKGMEWVVDECFTSFFCKCRGKEHLMVTYERILRHEAQVHSYNLVFLPPLSIHYFDVGVLSPYIVDADAVLLNRCHQLWTLVMDLYKKRDGHIFLKIFDPYD